MNGIIIQARMTSTRFPGKSMALLFGKPVLQHVIERAKMVSFIDKVIVAMPASKESEPMHDLCKKMQVFSSWGSEEDVLDRYYDAAQGFGLDTIMRITGDCPFLDPIVAGEVLSLLKAREFDYCSNVHPKRTYPKGFDIEVMTFDALEAAHIMSTKPYDREHVTPWLQRTRGVRRGCVSQRIDASSVNACVDEPEDIVRLEEMLKTKIANMEMEAAHEQSA